MSTQVSRTSKNSTLVLLLTTFIFALLIRYFIVLRADFPLNDGGMFYSMINELQSNGFRLPLYTSYNHAQIPFAYPPLPLYFTAALQSLTGIDLFTLLRLLPAFFSALSVPAFYLFSRSILGKEMHAFFAALIFAIQPESFEWEIMGGGITRAPAYLFSILALYYMHQTLTGEHKKRNCLWATIFISLTAWCHLEIAFFGAVTMVVMTLFWGRNRAGLVYLAAITFGGAILTAPYWLHVLLTHGLQTFLFALGSGDFALLNSLIRLMLIHMTVFRSMLVILIILGLFRQLILKEYFLPLLLLITILIDPRSVARSSILPAAMLASIALLDIIVPAMNSYFQNSKARIASFHANRWTTVLVIYLMVLMIFSTWVPHVTSESSSRALSQTDRVAMQWIFDNTPTAAKFLVITPITPWSNDYPAEWFPTLTDRTSLSTAQGTEWLPDQHFNSQRALSSDCKKCLGLGLDCLQDLEERYQLDYSYLYLSGLPWNASRLEFDLRSAVNYELVFEQDNIVIFSKFMP